MAQNVHNEKAKPSQNMAGDWWGDGASNNGLNLGFETFFDYLCNISFFLTSNCYNFDLKICRLTHGITELRRIASDEKFETLTFGLVFKITSFLAVRFG